MMSSLCDGIFTVEDDDLFRRLVQLVDAEGVEHFIEPSCCAALEGPRHLQWAAENGRTQEERDWCASLLENSVHVIWATGGALVPEVERVKFIERGRATRPVEKKKYIPQVL
jgi:D-serine dehydratase